MKSKRSSLSKERNRVKGRFGEGVTLGKVLRDGAIMEGEARYVIELDSEGNVIKHYRNPPFDSLANCIVVLAPAIFLGVFVEKAVCLEIGFGRFVPYKATEIKAVKLGKKKQCKVIHARHRLGVLPWGVMQNLLPTLWKAIQVCIDETMEGWTRARLIQDKMLGSKAYSVFEGWCSIRIPKDQPLLYALLRLKDEQDRILPGKNHDHVVGSIQAELDLFRSLNPLYSKEYNDDVLRKSQILRKLASKIDKNISFRGYTTRTLDTIKALLEKRNPQDLYLFNRVCKVFKVKEPQFDSFLDDCELVFGENKKELLSTCTLRPCRVVKYDRRRTKHAEDCYTIGVFGSRDHMLRITDRNTAKRLLKDDLPTNEDQDADIPF
jgi:hypothetical protein